MTAGVTEALGRLTEAADWMRWRVVEPGEAVEHVEWWYLRRGVERPETERDVVLNVVPVIETVLGEGSQTNDGGSGG